LSYDLTLALAVPLYIAFLAVGIANNILFTILVALKLRFARSLVKVVKVHRLVAISLVYT
jgi:hypothetical protein